MGPQNPKDVARGIARDLSGMAGELAALKADAHQWLEGPEYETPCATAWSPRTRLLGLRWWRRGGG